MPSSAGRRRLSLISRRVIGSVLRCSSGFRRTRLMIFSTTMSVTGPSLKGLGCLRPIEAAVPGAALGSGWGWLHAGAGVAEVSGGGFVGAGEGEAEAGHVDIDGLVLACSDLIALVPDADGAVVSDA